MVFLWRITHGGCSGHGDGSNRKKKQCRWWCAACGGLYDWRVPNRLLVIQVSAKAHEAKVFKALGAPQGLCDHLVNPLNLLTNQQKDGDSPIESIVTGLKGKSRKGIMEELRNSIGVDNHNAGDVERRNSSDKSMLSLGGMRRLSTNFKCRRKWKECGRKCVK